MENLKSYKLFESNDEITGVAEDILLALKDDEVKIEVKIVRDVNIIINIGESWDGSPVLNSNTVDFNKYREELEMLKSYLEDTYIYKGFINIFNNRIEWEDIFITNIDSVSLIFTEKIINK